MRILESMDLNFLLIYFVFELVLIVVTVLVARRLGRSGRVDPPGDGTSVTRVGPDHHRAAQAAGAATARPAYVLEAASVCVALGELTSTDQFRRVP